MINLQLSGLACNNYASSPALFLRSISLSNSFVSRSFSSFGYFASASLISSTFSRFLQSALVFETYRVNNSDYVSINFNLDTESFVLISQCSFLDCRSDKSGGALTFFRAKTLNPTFVITDSAFINCSSRRGGACFIFASIPSFLRCCFSCCQASSMGHALVIGNTDYNQTYIHSVTFIQCPASKSWADGCISLINRNHAIKYVNCSSAFKTGNGAGFDCTDSQMVLALGSIFSNNSGLSVFSSKNSTDMSFKNCIVEGNVVSISICAFYSTIPNAVIGFASTSFIRNSWENSSINYTTNVHLNATLISSFVDDSSKSVLGFSVKANDVPLANPSSLSQLATVKKCHVYQSDEPIKQKWISQKTVIFIIVSMSSLIIIGGLAIVLLSSSGRKIQISNWYTSMEKDIEVTLVDGGMAN